MSVRPRYVDEKSDASATHVWVVLWRAAHAVERNAIDSVSSLGLGLSEFAVLEILLHKGPQPVNTIGRKILLTSGSMTAAINRLEAKKLVRRAADTHDRRSRLVCLTETGKRVITDAFKQHAADMEETMSALTAEERLELIRLLKKVGLPAAARLERDHETAG